MRRGHRNKRRATKRFLPKESDHSSDKSSVGVYGSTQKVTLVTPAIPDGLAGYAFGLQVGTALTAELSPIV